MVLRASDVVIRGSDLFAVTLRFTGAGTMLEVRSSNVVISNVTITGAHEQGVNFLGGADGNTSGAWIHRTSFEDNGGTAVKINDAGAVTYSDDGFVTCSFFKQTEQVQGDTNLCGSARGVVGVAARGWTLYGNSFRDYVCEDALDILGGTPVLFSDGSRDLLLTANTFRDSFFGIRLGLQDSPTRVYEDAPCGGKNVSVVESTVCNNRLFVDRPARVDSGILLWRTCDTQTFHNSLYAAPGVNHFNAIEWRFSESENVHVANNLYNYPTRARDGATATLEGNVQLDDAQAATVFADVTSGDLHLAADAPLAENLGVAVDLSACSGDFEGHTRIMPTDVGADEVP
jgi:hypothetical protein